MPRLFPSLCRALALLLGAPAAFAASGNVDFPRYPSISPDARTIAFTWRGDIWSVPVSGGLAERLTSNPSNDLRTAWSPDAKTIAFNSSRLGGMNIFTMNADGSNVATVTSSDRTLILSGFTPDGKTILLSSSREGDVYRAPRPYKVGASGGEIERLMDCFGDAPQMSPDGTKVVFERGGSEWSRRSYKGPDNRDLWLYDVNAKSFTRLTTWDGNDGKARWRNNNTLVYLSDRELSTVNVYTMTLEGGETKARRLTNFEGSDVHDLDVSRDGTTCVCNVWDTLYTLNLREASPQARPVTVNAPEDLADDFTLKNIGKECTAAQLNPDGKTLAVIAYGQVYVRATEEKSPTRRVTTGAGRCREIAWSPDGVKLYYSGDQDGSDGLYVATVEKTRDEIKDAFKKTAKPDAKSEEPPKPADGTDKKDENKEEPKADAAKADDAAKRDKKDTPETDPAKLAERWTKAIRFKVEPVNTGRKGGIGGDNERYPSPSPDGKSLAFRRGRGDILILDLASGAVRTLLSSWDYENSFRWSPDSRFIAYSTNDENFNADIWIARADASKPPVNITRHPDNDTSPRWSADGKVLAFLSERRGDTDVYAVYLDKELESLPPQDLEKYYKDAAEAAKKRKPLGHEKKKEDAKKDESKKDEPKKDEPRKDEPKPAPSEPPTQAKADPAPADPGAKPADAPADKKPEADKKSDAEKKPEPPPFEPDLDDAYLRLRRITAMPGNEGSLEITPGGDRVIFTGNDNADGGEGLFSIKWNADTKDRKRLADGSPSVQGVSLTGDKVLFIDKGSTSTVPPDGGKTESLAVEDKVRLDLKAQAAQKFTEAARVLGEVFYHPTMKDLDWKTVSERYLALAKQTRTSEEFAYVGMRLVGELNASHLGVYPPPEPAPLSEPCGRLGINAAAAAAPDRVFQVTAVIPRGPASVGPMALKVGDLITAIDFEPFKPTDTLESRLRGKVGKEVTLTLKRAPKEGTDREELTALITPISNGAEDDLRYHWWADRNAEKVRELTGGKLGYLHIRAMGEAALWDFERDLFAAAEGKAGLLVDVRNNGGGSTADLVLASLMVRPHAYTVPRGAAPNKDAYPRDRLYIQRYTKPVNMLCNEKSFSNAEIISHAFKTLQRGHLCGQQTYGGVISTDATQLIDGTTVRLPFRGWFLPDGTDMESHGAMPDVLTVQTPEDESANRDRQLEEAAADLMKRAN